jgi:uncharacterized SAM-binding protein YcdF (DUF218 family)
MRMLRKACARRAVWTVFMVTPVALFVAIALWLDHAPCPLPEAGDHFDAIVVLGCRVVPGGAPSFALERRARHAASLYHAGLASFVVTTGGVGDFPPSEADVAARVLRAEGVPDSAILREDASTSTDENALFAKQRFGGRRVLVVTDAFHTWRAERVFARNYEEVVAVGTRSPIASERARGALREVLAVMIYWSLGRIDLDPRPRRGRARPTPVGDPLDYLKADLEERATVRWAVEYSDRIVDAVALELGRALPWRALPGFRHGSNGALIRGDEAG